MFSKERQLRPIPLEQCSHLNQVSEKSVRVKQRESRTLHIRQVLGEYMSIDMVPKMVKSKKPKRHPSLGYRVEAMASIKLLIS
jgi:hypothetical protein